MKYSSEHPVEIEAYLYPKNCTINISDGDMDSFEGGEQKFIFNKAEVEPEKITLIGGVNSICITRSLEYFDNKSDDEISCGVGVPDSEGVLKFFDAYVGNIYLSVSGEVVWYDNSSKSVFNSLVNYIVENMIPADKEVISHRNRNSEITSASIHGRSRVAAATIIGNSIHNASLIKSGRGKVM